MYLTAGDIKVCPQDKSEENPNQAVTCAFIPLHYRVSLRIVVTLGS